MKCKYCNGKGEVDNYVMGLGNSPEECCACKGTGIKKLPSLYKRSPIKTKTEANSVKDEGRY